MVARQPTLRFRHSPEERYRSLFDNAVEGIFRATPAGRFLEVNAALVKMLGYDLAEEVLALRQPNDVYVDPAQRQELQAKWEPVGVVEGAKLRWKKKNGEHIVVSLYGRVVRDARGRVAFYEGMVLDVTARTKEVEHLRQAEAHYRTLVERLPAVVFLAVPDEIGSTRYVNQHIQDLLGFSPAEWIADPALWSKQLHPEDRDRILDLIRQSARTGEPFRAEYRILARDGHVVWVQDQVVAATERDADGRPVTLLGFMLDITQQRRAEQARQESEERYCNLVEQARGVIYTVSADGVLTSLNPAFDRVTGWSRAEWLGQPLAPLLHPEDFPRACHILQQALQGETPPVSELRVRTRSGDYLVGEFIATSQMEGGKVVGVMGVWRDISERKRVEERYHTIFDMSPDLMYLVDPTTGHILHANRALLERVGLSLEEIRQKHFLDFFAGENREQPLRAMQTLLAGEEVRGLEIRAAIVGGAVRDYEINATPLKEHGRVIGILGLARDVTDRKQREVELQEQQRFIKRIADTIPDVLYIYDLTEERDVYVNEQIVPMLGYTPEEIRAKGQALLRELVHPDDVANVTVYAQCFIGVPDGKVVESEYRVRHANGEWRTFHNREIVFRRTPDGTPQQILGTAQDVTESRRIEELLRQGVIPRQALGEKLREFRETKLRLSQTEFGRRFGGYSQRQISHYENGEVEIPLRFLLTIAAQGYPFEEVLGADTAAVMHDTLRYVASSHWLRITGRQIIDILGQMLDRDREAGERVLDRFGVSAHGPSKEQEHLLALLVQLVAPRAAKT